MPCIIKHALFIFSPALSFILCVCVCDCFQPNTTVMRQHQVVRSDTEKTTNKKSWEELLLQKREKISCKCQNLRWLGVWPHEGVTQPALIGQQRHHIQHNQVSKESLHYSRSIKHNPEALKFLPFGSFVFAPLNGPQYFSSCFCPPSLLKCLSAKRELDCSGKKRNVVFSIGGVLNTHFL